MITIEQLLESVDLDFEPRWITKDSDEDDGAICVWDNRPTRKETYWQKTNNAKDKFAIVAYYINLAEFCDKDWQECIYEVPRKTTGKIEKLKYATVSKCGDVLSLTSTVNGFNVVIDKLNTVIDAVNELKGAKNE